MSEDDPRHRILNAAGPIFAEKGFEAATVREICQAAGVNLAAVNYYFGGKENLYREALTLAHPTKFGPAPTLQWPPGTPVEAKLKGFINGMLTRLLGMRTSSWQQRLMMREMMDPSDVCRELLREHLRAHFGQLQEILDEIVPAEMPAHKRHQIAFSILGQCVHYRSGRNIIPLVISPEELETHYGIDQLAEHIGEVSLAALGLRPPLACPHASGSDGDSNVHGEHTAQPAAQAGKGAS